MIKQHEPGRLASGVLAVVVHVAFVALLIFGIFPAGFVGLANRSQPAVQTAAQGSPPIAAAPRQ